MLAPLSVIVRVWVGMCVCECDGGRGSGFDSRGW